MRPMTEEALKAAFAGESQAHMKYLVFADQADKEGRPNIANLFRAVAHAERIHATNHLKALNGVDGTAHNLEIAKAGEDFEVEEMYPAYLATAELQDEKQAQRSMRYAADAEKVHADLYAAATRAVEAGEDLEGRAGAGLPGVRLGDHRGSPGSVPRVPGPGQGVRDLRRLSSALPRRRRMGPVTGHGNRPRAPNATHRRCAPSRAPKGPGITCCAEHGMARTGGRAVLENVPHTLRGCMGTFSRGAPSGSAYRRSASQPPRRPSRRPEVAAPPRVR
jgi:rubrerythrin